MTISVHADVSGASKITTYYGGDPATVGHNIVCVTLYEDDNYVRFTGTAEELLAFARSLLTKTTELAEQAGVVHTSTVADPELKEALLWRDSR